MIERSLIRIRTLRTLVSELLNLTAIETGNFTLRRAPLDVARVTRDAVDSQREHAQEREIELTLSGCGEGQTGAVLADRDALQMIIANLVDNAIKYTPERGCVQVRVEQSGMYVRVSVQETGNRVALLEIGIVAFDYQKRAKGRFPERTMAGLQALLT